MEILKTILTWIMIYGLIILSAFNGHKVWTYFIKGWQGESTWKDNLKYLGWGALFITSISLISLF